MPEANRHIKAICLEVTKVIWIREKSKLVLSQWQMVDKYPGRFDIEVLRDMPPHGYIIVFSGSHNTNL